MEKIDDAFIKFENFISEIESLREIDLSESDTRSKVIDKLLIEILGWNENDIKREGHVDSGYYDYRLSLAGFNVIVEAKKQFKKFIIPIKSTNVTLETLYNENKDVIDQIRNYMLDVGIDYGIITNGEQLIIGNFINHNAQPWKKNKCLIFNGFDDIKNRFIEFWNNLSKESIINNAGILALQKDKIEFSKTILSTLIERDNEIARNNIGSQIAPLIEKIFGEIYNSANENDKDFIKECFVENKEIIKNKAELNGLFQDLPLRLKEVIPARNNDSILSQINKELCNDEIIAKEISAPKPIIIIGSKGAGKTTFINFLFKNSLPEDTLGTFPNIYINFMNYYPEKGEINYEKIAEDILNQIDIKYPERNINDIKVLKRIYIKEIVQKDKGIWACYKNLEDDYTYNDKLSNFLDEQTKNKINHLEHVSQYFVREIHKRLILIFDNADQLSDEIQEKVFLFASSLNSKAHCGVFISLREGYYYKWRNQPPFNAFESNAYHISTPDYGIVLKKRINYALKIIKTEGKTISGYNHNGIKIDIGDNNIETFFIGLQNSLFGTENSPILDFIRHSTFPNIREGLRMFKCFLTSGYTHVEEYILRVVNNTDGHCITIPIHEFVKTIGLDNKLYYNHVMSIVPNLFYPCKNSSDYFLKIWILKRLSEQLTEDGNVNRYLQYSNLLNEFIEYGYNENIINQEIASLIQQGFIDIDQIISDIKWHTLPNNDLNITITAKGYYYEKEIINHFYYLELVMQDTPIYDSDTFEDIKTNFPLCNNEGKRDLNKRVEAVLSFIDYLKEKEKSQPMALKNKYGTIIQGIKSSGLNADISRIKSITN